MTDEEIEEMFYVEGNDFLEDLKNKKYVQLNEEGIEKVVKIIEEYEYIVNELEKWSEEYRFANIFKNKLQELKGSNGPSYEEMVGFVENVCKDIKSQSTLNEELEEERKNIAKIVGDFKEVNK